jgi:uncharacterized protein (DUF1499 family)
MKKWLSIGILFIIIVIILIIIYLNNKVPNLGIKDGQLKDLPTSPNAVSSQTEDSKRYVDPLLLKSNSYEILIDMLNDLDEAKIVKKNPNYIHAVFSTRIGFKDDVEFYFDEENKVIHFRSASRLGYSDMGKNKDRYEKIKNLYLKKISD